MPVITSNPRYERLAQNLAAGMKKGEACVDAGFAEKTALNAGDVLERNPIIVDRVRELLEERARRQVTETKIADKNERKAALTKILRHPIEAPVSAGHQVAASDQLNKMEGLYGAVTVPVDQRVLNIYVLDEATKAALGMLAQPRTAQTAQSEAKPADSKDIEAKTGD